MIIGRQQALKEYDKRTQHHAKQLIKLWKPVIKFVENVADEVQYHKRTCRFRIGNKWWMVRGTDGYGGIEVVDWDTKDRISLFQGYKGS